MRCAPCAMYDRSSMPERKTWAWTLLHFAYSPTNWTARISEIEAKVYQVKNQSGQDPLNYPIRVNNQIAALSGVVGSSEARPTKQSVTVFNILDKELEGYPC